MKKIVLLAFLVVLSLIATGCQSSVSSPTQTPTPTPTPQPLTVTYQSYDGSYTVYTFNTDITLNLHGVIASKDVSVTINADCWINYSGVQFRQTFNWQTNLTTQPSDRSYDVVVSGTNVPTGISCNTITATTGDGTSVTVTKR